MNGEGGPGGAPTRDAHTIAVTAATVLLGAVSLATAVLPLRTVPAFLSSAPWEFWALALFAVVADGRPFWTSRVRTWPGAVFASVCFTFSILLLWGAGPALAVQLVAATAGVVRLRFSMRAAVFTVARLVLALSAAQGTLTILKSGPYDVGMRIDRHEIVDIVLPSAAWLSVNYALIVVAALMVDSRRWRRLLNRGLLYEVLANITLLLLGPVLVSAPTGWTIVLLVVPLLAILQLGRLFAEQEDRIRLDPLTGLLNRRGLTADVEQLSAAAGSVVVDDSDRFALHLVVIDRIEYANEALGRTVGDRLQTEVGRRLRAVVGPRPVSRVGSGEFAVLAAVPGDADTAAELAAGIATALQRPVDLDGIPFDVQGTVGVAVSPADGRDVAALLRHADAAVHEARRAGTISARYQSHPDVTSADRLRLLADLREALENPDHAAEISIHYQPQVALRTGEVVAVEALLRWQHPGRGAVNAEDLFAVAEPSGVISVLSRRVVTEVLDQLARWNREGVVVRAAINVSMRDLENGSIVDHIERVMRSTGVNPHQVMLEITERELMTESRRVLSTMDRLDRIGIRLSLDDFGSGFTSIQLLRRLPVAELKLDRSLVRDLGANADDEAIVRSMIELARALGIRVVGEGVEDEPTRQRLADLGCDVGQGWFFARPMPADEVLPWIRARSA